MMKLATTQLSQFVHVGLAILLCLLALAVRLPGLDTFWTTDEDNWVEFTYDFLLGLGYSNYTCSANRFGPRSKLKGAACTFRTVHPGVTTMWAGTIGILSHYVMVGKRDGLPIDAYLRQFSVDPVEAGIIAPVRLPIVIMTSIFIALFFGLAAWLLNWRVALIAALLLTLDPYYAALSRLIHTDALSTAFMTLSLLMMLGYWWQGWSRRWLVASGLMTGLAILSKITAVYLLPFSLFCSLVALFSQKRLGTRSAWLRWFGDEILWGLSIGLVCLALFPAIWVIPDQLARDFMLRPREIANDGHMQFFLGQVSGDPGWLFYPVSLLFRLSPLILVGIAGLVLGVTLKYKTINPQSDHRFVTFASKAGLWLNLVVYVLFFLIILSIPGKKLTRYALPILPILSLIAASGLIWLADGLTSRLARSRAKLWTVAALGMLVLAVQGWFIVQHYPYYMTYYSPVFGGAVGASQVKTIIGWGEGHDQAAAYFNQKPEAAELRVVNWNLASFAPFFSGVPVDYSFSDGNVLSADYIVVSIRQRQNQQITPTLWTYLQKHATLEHTITLHGVDYILIYRLPIQNSVRWKDNQIKGVATLFGYNIETDRLRIFWQNDGLPLRNDWWFGLQSSDNGVSAWQRCELAPDFSDERTAIGAILESECPFPEKLPSPGVYDLYLGVGPSPAYLEQFALSEGLKTFQIEETGQLSLFQK